MIIFSNYPSSIGSKELTKIWLKEIAKSHSSRIKRLNFNFVSNDELLEINRKHLNHDYYTDIITFEYGSKLRIEGEVFISTDQVAIQASEYKVSKAEEMKRVIAHGLLHLIGFNDRTEEEKAEMRIQEEKTLILHAQIIGN